MTLSGGDNGCSGSVMTLNGDTQTFTEVDPGAQEMSALPSCEMPPRCNGDGAADSDAETNTPRGSMENFPPPPDFLLQDDLTKSFNEHNKSVGDGCNANTSTMAPELEALQSSLPVRVEAVGGSDVSAPAATMSPEELSKEVAKQLAPIYQQRNNQLTLGGNNSSSQTSQNSSPSSLDQLSPLLDDDHPSPPSPCPPSPCPQTMNYPPLASPSPEHNSPQELIKGYSLFAPPQPIQDEGLSKRRVSVSEAVRSLQTNKHQPSSPGAVRKLSAPTPVTTKQDSADKAIVNGAGNPITDKAGDSLTNKASDPVTNKTENETCSTERIDAARASIITTLSSKMTQQQQVPNNQSTTARGSSQYDPYTQPLPMTLHQEEVMLQVRQQKTESRPLPLSSPNHNTQALPPNASPNANTQQLLQQQQLEQLQQQQQQLLQQQQQLKQLQQQSTGGQTLITKPESRAFLATLNSTLSSRPVPPQKSPQVRSNAANNTAQKSQLRTQLGTQASNSRSPGGPNKTPLRSSLSAPKQTKPKRSIVMGTASRSNSSPSSSIPQPNSSINSPSNRLSRTASSSSDKFKFRQLIAGGRNTSSGHPRETAASSLASSRPKSVAGSAASSEGVAKGATAAAEPSSQLSVGLLEQIRKGAKLRQTKQVADRSAPRVH